MLADFKTRSVGIEMMKWKRKQIEALGVEGGMKSQVPLSRRGQVNKMLEEEKTPVPRLEERVM